MLSNPPLIIELLLLLLVLPAARWDIRYRRIPNWLCLSGIMAGIGLNTFLYETPGLWMSLEGIGLAFAIYFPLYLLHGMGAGDVKLMAAVGAIAGWQNWLGILVLTSLCGAAAGLVLIARNRRFRGTFDNIGMIIFSLRTGHAPYRNLPQLDVQSEGATRLPHAAAIACGSVGFLAAAAIWARK